MNELLQDFLNGRRVLVVCPTYFAIKVFAERLLNNMYGVKYKHEALQITGNNCGTIQFTVGDELTKRQMARWFESMYITKGVDNFAIEWLNVLRSTKYENLKLVFFKDKWEDG